MNLIHYWPFNSDLNDIIGAKNLSYGSNCGLGSDRSGRANNAINLNTGYYNVPSGIYFNGDFTFSLWFNLRVLTDTPTFFEVASVSLYNRVTFSFYNLLITVGFEDGNKALLLNCYTSTQAVSLNSWTHTTIVYSNLKVQIYVNSIEQSVTCSANVNKLPSNVIRSVNFIGRTSYYSTRPDIQADLDEIKIYNKGLSLDEVQADYF